MTLIDRAKTATFIGLNLSHQNGLISRKNIQQTIPGKVTLFPLNLHSSHVFHDFQHVGVESDWLIYYLAFAG